MTRSYSWRRTAMALGVMTALALAARPATAGNSGHGGPIVEKQALENDGADADAKGQTRFVLRQDAAGRFDVTAKRLAPDATFQVVVDGVMVGRIQTSGGGNGSARFSTQPSGHDQLLGFDPRGAHVVVRDAAGNDVLTGTVPDDSVDPTEVACCLPGDDSEASECEQRTADECTQAGGTVASAATCLPNPCEAAPPGGQDVVCCLPHDGGAECEDLSEADCAARSGTVVTAASCDPNPCAATPPANEIQCCTTEDDGSECELRTPTECADHGGTDMGAGTCSPDPCGGSAASGGEGKPE